MRERERVKKEFGTRPVRGAAAAAAKSLQSCPTMCDPTDGSPPASPIPGIFQAITLEWVAISVSSERGREAEIWHKITS